MNQALALRRLPDQADSAHLRVMDITKFYSAASGGVRTYLDAKVNDFETRDIVHSLVIPGRRDEVSRQHHTRVYRLKGPVLAVSPHYRLLLSARAIERVIERERPDVIEVGSPFLVPWLVRRAIRGRATRTVGFYHSDLVRTYAEPLVPHVLGGPVRVAARNLARAYIRRVYRLFDVTVAASPVVADELRTLGIGNVECIPLGVDLDVFRPDPRERTELRRRVHVAEGVPIALYVGRFCAEKRLDVVLDAHARLPREERPHLVLVGGGPHEKVLNALAERVPDLTVMPFMSDRHELAQTYRGADLYLASGPGETFGLAIAEAMACGVPVVAVDRGAAPDRVRGSNAAELYQHGSAESCALAIRRMMLRLSPALRERAAAHAARTHGWRHTFDALCQLYAGLAPRRRV